jgi:hypothetical protein
MNFTTKDIDQYRDQTRKDIYNNAPYILQAEEEIERNRDIEIRALGTKSSICSPKLSGKIAGNMDFGKLESEMGEQFMNYDAMRAIGCSVYATFHGIPESSGDIAKLAHLKDSIRNLHKFGSESVNGYALTGEIDDAKDMFVIKTPRTKEAEEDLLHETFVGLFGINKMRKEGIPNMAMIFGGLKCSKVVINQETNEVESYCAPSPNVIPYVIYENISPSKSFDAVIRTCTISEFHSLYMQVLLATYIGSVLIGYTHYDAHTGNWLVRKINVSGITDVRGAGGKFCIPYKDPITKKVLYVVADSVATAIDFGMTSINYKGTDIGSSMVELEEYGITSGPWPLHDAYKLLMFSALALITSKINDKVLNEIRKIFRFFNGKETLEDAVKLQRKSYYSLPKTDKTAKFSILDLIIHIRENCNVSDILLDNPSPLYPILECTTCSTFVGTMKNGYIKNPHPKDFFEFYDFASHYGSISKETYDNMVMEFDYDSAFKNFQNKVEDDISTMNKLILAKQQIRLPTPLNARQLANPNVEKVLRGAYTNLIGAISRYEDINLWLKVGMSVVILFQDDIGAEYINGKRDELKSSENKIKARIAELREIYGKIKPIIEASEWDIYNAKYPWYASSGEIIYLRDRFEESSRDLFAENRLPSTLVRTVKQGVLPQRRQVELHKNSSGEPVKVVVKRK